jgi:DNA-binding response OmpR family regulator
MKLQPVAHVCVFRFLVRQFASSEPDSRPPNWFAEPDVVRQTWITFKHMNHHLQSLRPDQFRVLVVVDEIYAQKALVEYARQEGYRVDGTGDAKEAVRMFAQDPAHLVIADLTRRQLHAAEMVAALKKHRGSTCAVGVVDKLPPVDEQAEDDFEGYIVKPISRENVSEQLRELLLTPSEDEKPKVYVVDDDGNALMAVEHTLDVRGFDVTPYTDIGEAIEQIQVEPPDLLILDVNMPGISGLQVCQQLKANPKTDPIPILIFTSDPSRENVTKAIESGANGFIAKPFDPKGLTAKVREVLEASN